MKTFGLALGGGAVMDPQTRERLARHRVVYLQTGFTAAVRRVGLDSPRPLLIVNPRTRMRELLAERLPVYASLARITVVTDDRDPQEIADDIAAAVTARIAAAAAIAGLARCVRAPGPWRPTKLRLEVDTLRCPGGTRSPLEATHIEQPGSRHSKPASRKTRSSPSASAWRLIVSEPGTTQAVTCEATLRPLASAAASCRSDSRELVHEPMNTQSTGVPAIGAPALRPM